MGTGWTQTGKRCRRCNQQPDRMPTCTCSGQQGKASPAKGSRLARELEAAALTQDLSARVAELSGNGSVMVVDKAVVASLPNNAIVKFESPSGEVTETMSGVYRHPDGRQNQFLVTSSDPGTMAEVISHLGSEGFPEPPAPPPGIPADIWNHAGGESAEDLLDDDGQLLLRPLRPEPPEGFDARAQDVINAGLADGSIPPESVRALAVRSMCDTPDLARFFADMELRRAPGDISALWSNKDIKAGDVVTYAVDDDGRPGAWSFRTRFARTGIDEYSPDQFSKVA